MKTDTLVKANEMMDEALKKLKEIDDKPKTIDVNESFGKLVTEELGKMERSNCLLARRMIHEILFLGSYGLITLDTRIENSKRN